MKKLACHSHRQRYGLNSGVGGSNPGHVTDFFADFLINPRQYLEICQDASQKLFLAIYYDIPISLRRLQIFLPSGCGPLAAFSIF